jgi:peptidoglycan/LPS O-acetylase OafA/YrhL
LASNANEKVAPLLSTFPFAVLIFAFAKFENFSTTKIPDAVAYWAATLSFGVYAWHVPLAGIVESYSPGEIQSNVILRLLVLTSFSCLIGWLVSKYFEKPIQRKLRRIAQIKLG